jgi:hypothetical protein
MRSPRDVASPVVKGKLSGLDLRDALESSLARMAVSSPGQKGSVSVVYSVVYWKFEKARKAL